MNKFVVLFIFCLVFHSAIGLRCWECNNARTNDECITNGTLVNCVEQDAICEDQVRHYQQGNIMIIEKRCKQSHACDNNVVQNARPAYPIQCHVVSPTSTCRCCCSTDGCNRDLLACWNAYPTFPVPDREVCAHLPEQPEYGVMQCNGNKEPGTYCDFKCNNDYYLVGRRRLTCLDNYEWDYPVPTCNIKRCGMPYPFSIINGAVRCSNGNKYRSRCTFTCKKGYGVIGPENIDCVDAPPPNSKTAIWSSRRAPVCRRRICPPQGPLVHGGFGCTNKRNPGSACHWRCHGEFEIFPTGWDVNVCLPSGQWNRPFPCCTLPCLPYAVVDLLVILDSSSSVGSENWGKMKTFVRMLFGQLAMEADAAQFAVFRYNENVDTHTEIRFGQFIDNFDAFLAKYDEIPYNGTGTNTGRALNHAAVNVLPGKRILADDIVILITDGNSNDRVNLPARQLQHQANEIIVVPVKPPKGDPPNITQMEEIAGNRRNVVTTALDTGFDALDDTFAEELANRLCPDPCSNPFHDQHEPRIPARLLPYI